MLIESKEDKNLGTTENLKENQEHENEIVHKHEKIVEEKENKKSVGFFKLEYSQANKKDIFLIAMACLGSMVAGAAMPLISLLLGKVINQFNGTIAPSAVPGLVSGLITNFLAAGVAIFAGSFMMVFFWFVVGRRLINKINGDYFRVIMQQEQGWFDKSNMFEFATKVQFQVKTIENGVRRK